MYVPVSGRRDCPRLFLVLRTTPTSAFELATKGASAPFSKPLSMHRTGPSTVGTAVREELELGVEVWELLEVAVLEDVCVAVGEPVRDDVAVDVWEGLAVRELVGVMVSVMLDVVVPVEVAEDVTELVGVMLDVAVVVEEEERVAVRLEVALEVALIEAVAVTVSLADAVAVVVALPEGVIVEVDDVVGMGEAVGVALAT